MTTVGHSTISIYQSCQGIRYNSHTLYCLLLLWWYKICIFMSTPLFLWKQLWIVGPDLGNHRILPCNEAQSSYLLHKKEYSFLVLFLKIFIIPFFFAPLHFFTPIFFLSFFFFFFFFFFFLSFYHFQSLVCFLPTLNFSGYVSIFSL